MLYIYMLDYDFGHMEAVSLISAPNCPEKQVGYIVISGLLNENPNFLRLAIKTLRNDIIDENETFQCVALTMVQNIGGREFAKSLAPVVRKLLLSSCCGPLVRKKAALCLLSLYRKNPDVVNVDGWVDQMAQLLDERDLGVLTCSMSLFVGLVSNNHEAYWICLPKCVKILEHLARNQDVPQEYTYYGIPSPWLQVKTMRALQCFPAIDDPKTRKTLFKVLQQILDTARNDNENDALHAVFFEALALVMHLDDEKEMMSKSVELLLGKNIAFPEPEPNIRYLVLKNMTRMLMATDLQDIIERFQALSLEHLHKDEDPYKKPIEDEDTIIEPYIQSSIDSAERFPDLCLKDSGVLYDDPNIEICFKAEWQFYDGHLVLTFQNKSTTTDLVSVQAHIVPSDNLMMNLTPVPDTIAPCEKVPCLLSVANLWPSGDVAILKFSYKFGKRMVMDKLSIPVVLNTFFRPIKEDFEELKRQCKLITGPLLKVQGEAKLDRPVSIFDMAHLLNSIRIVIYPFDANSNVLVGSTRFYSWYTGPMLCMIEIQIDPAKRTDLTIYAGSGDYKITHGLMTFLESYFMSPLMEKSSNYS
ncbi:hypothetical protein CCACVL1_23238 [Corchorus capsularis]|uniref:Clathrin adaptor alpha/beta/gamma-adaptin appendage Ig-like subdomain domain-containing protein n=1 Tax=Corchorus capsularis TaxID=210143 RepID=A0A1R3GUV6_COCAP|nr:hypothetical protein CCACVL1_23238 [Corchorus capsularis]